MRVLPLERIPEDLWKSELLRLPPHLSTVYLAHLNRLGLTQLSTDTTEKDVHGGKSTAETHNHFARRFAVSAGRVEFSTLGPRKQLESLSDAFLSTFSDGHVGLLDIPCGTGAMSCALVSTLIKLRQDGVVSRLPLTISVCGGDYSAEALTIFNLLMHDLAEPASAQGINLVWETQEWDATRGDQTARLVDRWFTICRTANEHFVVVSNFSGALHNQGALNAFSPCFEQVLARLHDKQCTVVWVEPATKSAKSGVLAWLPDFITKRITWFIKSGSEDANSLAEAEYQLEHPVSGLVFRSNIAVHRFDRT